MSPSSSRENVSTVWATGQRQHRPRLLQHELLVRAVVHVLPHALVAGAVEVDHRRSPDPLAAAGFEPLELVGVDPQGQVGNVCVSVVHLRNIPAVFTSEQRAAFDRDGFLIVERDFISPAQVDRLRERFEAIFREEYETGIKPDEVNWVAGRDPENRTRQICNGWKADTVLAEQVLSEHTGAACAELMGYDGVRILQDNCIWKPPGTLSLGMHQDGAYLDYLVPGEMITCWIALEPTSAEAGTMTFVTGSHHWPRSEKNRGEFHAPPDWLDPGPPGQSRRARTPSSSSRRSWSQPAARRSTTTTPSTGRARTPRPAPTGAR